MNGTILQLCAAGLSQLDAIISVNVDLPQKLFGIFTFYFASFSDFLDMASSGISYGFFVWLSYGLTYLLLVALLGWSLYQDRQLKHQIAAKVAREQRIKQYQEHNHNATTT